MKVAVSDLSVWFGLTTLVLACWVVALRWKVLHGTVAASVMLALYGGNLVGKIVRAVEYGIKP